MHKTILYAERRHFENPEEIIYRKVQSYGFKSKFNSELNVCMIKRKIFRKVRKKKSFN